MGLRNSLLSALDIRKGEETAISLMVLYSFFMGTAIAFFYTATISMFLENFERATLPYAYIASGVAGYILWYFYAQFQKKLVYSKLLSASVWFLLITVALLATLNATWGHPWLPFVMYVWIKVFTFLSSVSFWGMASRIFDLRQGKRLFGLIGSGAVLSDIIGFFSVPFLLKVIKTPDLLYIAIVGLVLCLFCMAIISRKYAVQLHARSATASTVAGNKQNQSVGEFLQNKYYLFIFILAILPMFGIYFVDYIFLGQVRQEFTNKEVLTGFLGIFFGVVAVIEFIVKTFISGRLLSNYGLKVGLLALPVLVGAITLGATFAGIIGGTTGLFFSLVALDKLIERTARTSLNDTSFQILYQPLPADERLAFQSKVEGVPKAIGNVIAGGSLLLFAFFGLTNLLYVCYILLFLSVIWIFVTLKMHREYRKVLTDSIMGHSGQPSEHVVEAPTHEIQLLLDSSIVEQRIVGLSLLENIEPFLFLEHYKTFIKDESPLVRQYVFKKMGEFVQTDMLDPLKAHKETDSAAAEILNQTIASLTKIKASNSEQLHRMAHGNVAEKVAVAHYLGNQKGSANLSKLLAELLTSDATEVEKAAIVSVAKQKMRERLPKIIEYAATRDLCNTSVSALVSFGDLFLIQMEAAAVKSGYNEQLQRQMAKVYGRVGTKLAQTYLFDRIHSVDYALQKQVLYALSLSGFQVTEDEHIFVKNGIEREIEHLIWATAAVLDLPPNQPEYQLLIESLEDEILNKRNVIFLWLSIMYDPQAIKNIQKNVESPSGNRAFILEVTDMIVSPEIKEMLLPILDDVSHNERLNALRLQFPQEKLAVTDRIKDIAMAESARVNQWTRACALHAVIEMGHSSLYTLLISNINNPDMLMSQLGICGMNLLDRAKLEKYQERLQPSEQARLLQILSHAQGKPTYFENVLLLRKVKRLANIRAVNLISLALAMEKITAENQMLVPEIESYSYIILQGKCNAIRLDGTSVEAKKMRMIGTCTEYHHLLLKSGWTAAAATELVRIPNIVLYSLFSDAPETIQQLRLAMDGKVAMQERAQQAIEVSATV